MKKVLLIDDDPVITTLYAKHFRSDGFQVRVANSGKDGIGAVQEFRPDAVVLDLSMPDLNGVQWLHEVRSDPRFARLPVIVFSAGAINWQVWAANNADVSFMFKEGAVPADIVQAVRSALGVREEAAMRSSPD